MDLPRLPPPCLHSSSCDGVHVIVISGALDGALARDVEDRLALVDGPVVVDLQECTAVGPGGLTPIVARSERAAVAVVCDPRSRPGELIGRFAAGDIRLCPDVHQAAAAVR